MTEARRRSRPGYLTLGLEAWRVALPPPRRGAPRLLRRSVPAMGAVADLAVVHADPGHARLALAAAVAELHRMEALLSRFRPTSDVGRANRAALREPVPVHPETAEVVEEALRWAVLSDGAFDPCLERIAGLWGAEWREAPPADAELRPLAGRRLYRTVEAGRRAGRPVLLRGEADAGLDLGGIARGYGVDRAVAVLRDWGIRDGFVALGGDLYALGVGPDGAPWRVEAGEGRAPGALRLSDRAVGIVPRAVRRGQSILDPASGRPRGGGALAVAADRCTTTDAGTTACFGMAPPDARALLARAGGGAELVNLT